jgi:DNA primase
MDSQIEEIKSKTDIVALISSYMKLSRAGRNYKGLCPFHSERTPSFTVSAERGTWRCFGCGEHGDAISFVEKHDNITFREALEQLAKRAGVELTKLNPEESKHQQAKQRLYDLLQFSAQFYHFILTKHQLGEEARVYTKDRLIHADTIEAYTLGFAPNSWHSLTQFLQKKGFKPEEIIAAGMGSQSNGRFYDRYRGRLMFPVTDIMNRVVGFSGRSLVSDPKVPKYLNNGEGDLFHKGKLLYGLQQAKETIRKTNRIILVEGNVDVLSSHQAGIKEVVAPLGTALTAEQISVIKRFTQNIYIAFDQDHAGVEAVRRSIELLRRAELNIKIVELIDGSDPDDCIKRNPANWTKSIEQAKDVFDYYLVWASQTFDLSTESGKINASREIIPLITATESSVAQAFLIHKTANALSLDEEAVKAEMKRTPVEPDAKSNIQNTAMTAKAPVRRASKSRGEVLIEYILTKTMAIIAQGAPRETLRDTLKDINLEAVPSHHSILQGIINGLGNPGEIKLNTIAASLSPEDAITFDRLNLTDTDRISLTIDEQIQDLQQAIRELHRLSIKNQLNSISRSLKQAEQLDKNQVDELQRQFMALSQQLRQLQAS